MWLDNILEMFCVFFFKWFLSILHESDSFTHDSAVSKIRYSSCFKLARKMFGIVFHFGSHMKWHLQLLSVLAPNIDLREWNNVKKVRLHSNQSFVFFVSSRFAKRRDYLYRNFLQASFHLFLLLLLLFWLVNFLIDIMMNWEHDPQKSHCVFILFLVN